MLASRHTFLKRRTTLSVLSVSPTRICVLYVLLAAAHRTFAKGPDGSTSPLGVEAELRAEAGRKEGGGTDIVERRREESFPAFVAGIAALLRLPEEGEGKEEEGCALHRTERRAAAAAPAGAPSARNDMVLKPCDVQQEPMRFLA